MNRIKSFAATGVAPDGKLFAGDLNAIQDAAAALTDLTQTLSVGTLRIGETGLQLVRFGAGEARITGAFRADGIVRGGALLPATYTTAQRDAIAAGGAPTGIAIYNSTNAQWEWNKGTDGARNWQPIGLATVTSGDLSAGSVTTTKIADGAVTNVKLADGSVDAAKLASGAVTTIKIGDGQVTSLKIADGNVTNAKIGGSAVDGSKIAGGSIIAGHIVDGQVIPQKLSGWPSTPVTQVSQVVLYVFGSPNTFTITAPVAGTYIVEWGTNHYDTENTNASSSLDMLGLGGISPSSNNPGHGMVGGVALGAGQVLTIQANHGSGASAGRFDQCWAKLTRTA